MISNLAIASTVVIGQSYNITWVTWLQDGEQPELGTIGIHRPFTEFGATEFNISEASTESPYLWTVGRNLEAGQEYQLLWMSTNKPEDGVFGGPSFNVTDILLPNIASATPSTSASISTSQGSLPTDATGPGPVSSFSSTSTISNSLTSGLPAALSTTTSSQNSQRTVDSTDSSASRPSPGSIVGIAIGAFLGACMLALAAFFIGRRKSRRPKPIEEAQQKTVENDDFSWNKSELDGKSAKAELDGSGTLSTGSAAELDSKSFQELPPNEVPQELPHFNHAPQELPADIPKHYKISKPARIEVGAKEKRKDPSL